MYKRNVERLNRIKKLREQNLTIDQIAAKTGDPRASVGYYVTKYCGGRIRTRNLSSALSVQPETSKIIRGESDSKRDRVEEYMQELERKESLSLEKDPVGKAALEMTIEEMFLRDPEILCFRLLLLEKLIRLQPFLRIDLDRMRLIRLYLAEDRNLGRSPGSPGTGR
jgi:DNA-binding transcriptional MerR regulator